MKRFSILVVRVLFFIIASCLYLFLGYHLRDYIIDFSTFSFIQHPGVVQGDYITNINELSSVISPQSRWLTNIVVTSSMILLVSFLIFLIFLKLRYALIAIVFYIILITICVIFIVIGNTLNTGDLGYHFARFIKDQLIHSPFVFILLVSCLKVFKV